MDSQRNMSQGGHGSQARGASHRMSMPPGLSRSFGPRSFSQVGNDIYGPVGSSLSGYPNPMQQASYPHSMTQPGNMPPVMRYAFGSQSTAASPMLSSMNDPSNMRGYGSQAASQNQASNGMRAAMQRRGFGTQSSTTSPMMSPIGSTTRERAFTSSRDADHSERRSTIHGREFKHSPSATQSPFGFGRNGTTSNGESKPYQRKRRNSSPEPPVKRGRGRPRTRNPPLDLPTFSRGMSPVPKEESPTSARSQSELPASRRISGEAFEASQPNGKHVRMYKACDNCHMRKRKCDMGRVDNPHEPPCAGCRREFLRCTFTNLGRKRGIAANSLFAIDNGFKLEDIENYRPLAACAEDPLGHLQKHELFDGKDAILTMTEISEHQDQEAGKDALKAEGDANGTVEGEAKTTDESEDKAMQDAIKAWSKCTFVYESLMTAREGIEYVMFFYKHLKPMTPVALADFSKPANHATLLQDEPLLAAVILMIASRFVKFKGTGSTIRALHLHERVWDFVCSTMNSLLWGADQPTDATRSNVQSPVATQTHPSAPIGLRTLGTIEAFLLLTEWHARGIHFPKSNKPFGLCVGLLGDFQASRKRFAVCDATGHFHDVDSVRHEWIETCNRADRMCLSLLSQALGLAHQLGVMDVDENMPSDLVQTEAEKADCSRRLNLKRLLYVFITQTCGRMSVPSLIRAEWFPDKEPHQVMSSGYDPLTASDSDSVDLESATPEVIQDAVIYFWHRLGKMFFIANNEIWPNRERTRAVVTSKEYRTILTRYSVAHNTFLEDFEHCKLIPHKMRCILMIEFEYMRVYGYSLALAAVIERASKNGAENAKGIIPPQEFRNAIESDNQYIQNIVFASQNLLRIVVEELLPSGSLKFVPLRTYLRIAAVAMVLLKSFTFGASESDAASSLSLMDRVIDGLKSCVVDDIHIGNRFSEHFRYLTKVVREKLVRIQSGTRTGTQSPAIDGTHLGLNGHAGLNNDFLGGVNPQLYDLTDPDFSIMPPPQDDSEELDDGSWYALPADWTFSGSDMRTFNPENNMPGFPNMQQNFGRQTFPNGGHMEDEGF